MSGVRELLGKEVMPIKIKIIPILKEIIENGKQVGEPRDVSSDNRTDGIKMFYYIQANVKVGKEPKKIQIDIAEDVRGRKFYFASDRT